MMKKYIEYKSELLNDPTIHDSLKQVIRIFNTRDCFDSYYDAKLLVELMGLRVNEHRNFSSGNEPYKGCTDICCSNLKGVK